MGSPSKIRGILTLLVPQVVESLVEHHGMDEGAAIELVMGSQTYAALEDEQTKLWHLSPRELAWLCAEERERGYVAFPEEV